MPTELRTERSITARFSTGSLRRPRVYHLPIGPWWWPVGTGCVVCEFAMLCTESRLLRR